MAKINFSDKVSVRTSSLPDINTVRAADLNEIKASVNFLYDNPVVSTDDLSDVIARGNTTGANPISMTSGQYIEWNEGISGSRLNTLPTTGGAKVWSLPNATGTIALEGIGISSFVNDAGYLTSGDGDGIYTSSGSLSGATVVTMGANPLTFDGNETIFRGLTSIAGSNIITMENSIGSSGVVIGNDGEFTHSSDLDSGVFRIGVWDYYTNGSVTITHGSPTAGFRGAEMIGRVGSIALPDRQAYKLNTLFASPNLVGHLDLNHMTGGGGSLVGTRIQTHPEGAYFSIGSVGIGIEPHADTVLRTSGNDVQFKGLSGVDNTFYMEESTARVGIGTYLPGAKLHVELGDILFKGLSGTTTMFHADDSIDSVGIGGLADSLYKLKVTGDINVTGVYKVGGVSGFTGTGAYTNFTIVGGIITAAS